MNTDPLKSAAPCGCDEGAGWTCDQHKKALLEMAYTRLQGIEDSGKRETYASGAMRDPGEGKIKWSRITFGPMLRRWAQHLTTAEAKYPDPKPGVPNFSLINTEEEFLRYKESAYRHFMDWFYGKTNEDHAAAVFFNINGVEIIKAKLRGEVMPTWKDDLLLRHTVPPGDLGSVLRNEEDYRCGSTSPLRG